MPPITALLPAYNERLRGSVVPAPPPVPRPAPGMTAAVTAPPRSPSWQALQVLHQEMDRGKGAALRKGYAEKVNNSTYIW